MTDETPFYAPNHKIPSRRSQPGELLCEFHVERTKKFYRIELRDHGRRGVEVQIFEGEHNFYAQHFRDVQDGDQRVSARELAIAWAESRAETVSNEE